MEQRFRRGFTAAEKTELWDRWQRGESLKAIGRAFGINISANRRRCRPAGPRRIECRHVRPNCAGKADDISIMAIAKSGVSEKVGARIVTILSGTWPSTINLRQSNAVGWPA